MAIARTAVIASLGTTQTLAWASSYYLPAIVAGPAASDLGLSRAAFFGAFSGSLLLSAALAPSVGRAIDRHGGRAVLTLSNLVLAAGLALLGTAHGAIGLGAAWIALGIGMSMGLYDAAFAALAGFYGREARGPITGITLVAGFASTIGWPLTTLFDDTLGWRGACFAWAALNLLVALPMNRLLLPASTLPQPAAAPRDAPEPATTPAPRFAMAVLAFVFAAVWFVTGAMAAHLPRLLQIAADVSPATALFAATLVGPAQVAARLVEFGLLRRVHPLVSARLAAVLHPIGAALLLALGTPATIAFALLHGAGNGMMTIAKGTLPLALFGATGYGLRTGLISLPARATQALAPLIFSLLLDRMGRDALIVSSALMLAALAALMTLSAAAPRRQPAQPLRPSRFFGAHRKPK